MNKLLNSIDKVYLINLEHRTDRLSVFLKSFKKAGLPQDKLQIFKAINGNEIAPSTISHLSAGEIGCLESHLAVLKSAFKEEHKIILVLEDDIRFCRQFKKKLQRAMDELPDNWDMLYLYSYHYTPPIIYSKHLNKCTSTLSTVGYLVNQKCYQQLICAAEKRDNQIDVIYAIQHNMINAYATNTTLCIHYDGFSDVKNKDVRYILPFSMKLRFKVKKLISEVLNKK